MCIVCCISMQCTKFSSKWEHKDIKSAIKPKLVNRKTTLVSGEKFLFEERRIVTGGQPSGDHTLSCSGPSRWNKTQEAGGWMGLGAWHGFSLPELGHDLSFTECWLPEATCHVSRVPVSQDEAIISQDICVCQLFPRSGSHAARTQPQPGCVCSTMGFCPVRGEQRGAPTTFCCDNFTYITSPRHTTDRWTQKTKSFIQLSLAI